MDSIESAELMKALEHAFGIEIGNDEAVNMQTAGETAALVCRQVARPGSQG